MLLKHSLRLAPLLLPASEPPCSREAVQTEQPLGCCWKRNAEGTSWGCAMCSFCPVGCS